LFKVKKIVDRNIFGAKIGIFILIKNNYFGLSAANFGIDVVFLEYCGFLSCFFAIFATKNYSIYEKNDT